MKKYILMLILATAACFAQTPCIQDAQNGKVGLCLTMTVKVTDADAQFVPVWPVQGYHVDPTLPYSMKLEFSTMEQSLAIASLITFRYPGSKLTITDTGTNYSFPPFRALKYFNDGSMFAPRIYTMGGTVRVQGSDFRVNFEPGWTINVIKLIYGGSYEMQEQGYPFGSSMLILFFEQGIYQPVWVGGPQQQ